MPTYFYNSSYIELQGLRFRVELAYDYAMRSPWVEFDNYGIVGEWQRVLNWCGQITKAPYERVICRDGSSFRLYDVRATRKRAKAEGWGLSPNALEALKKRLGRDPTSRQILAEVVERDFQRLRAWCNDEWHFCVLIVTLLDVNGKNTDAREILGGLESDDESGIAEYTNDLALELAARVGDASTIAAEKPMFIVRAA